MTLPDARKGTVDASLLIEDLNLYPRQRVNELHVNDLRRAMEAGANLPPVIADRSTKQIIDGFHRRRAYMAAYGESVKIPVEWRSYASDADRLADAIRLNAIHGLRLSRADETRCVVLSRSLGMDDHTIAVAMNVPEARVQQLSVRVVMVDGETVPAKPVLAHKYGQEVTKAQADAQATALSGQPLLRTINGLLKVVDSGAYDGSRPEVLEALHTLADTIKKKVMRPTLKA